MRWCPVRCAPRHALALTVPASRARRRLLHRLVTLNGMRASEELSEEQARQLTFDLDNAYGEFHRFLQSLKK